MTDMVQRTREVVARGDVLTDEEVLAMADEIERLRNAADKLAALMADPLRADDGEYDYDADAVDATLATYRAARFKPERAVPQDEEAKLRAKAEELYRKHCRTIPGPPSPPLFFGRGPLVRKVQAEFLEKARAALADGET